MTLKVIVVNVSSTLTNTTIWFVAALCFISHGRTVPFVRTSVRDVYRRKYGWTDGHFYLKTVKRVLSARQLDINHIVHIQCLRQMQGRRQVKKCEVHAMHGHAWRTRRARAYNGCFGAESPAGSKGRSPGQGVGGGGSPLKLKTL